MVKGWGGKVLTSTSTPPSAASSKAMDSCTYVAGEVQADGIAVPYALSSATAWEGDSSISIQSESVEIVTKKKNKSPVPCIL